MPDGRKTEARHAHAIGIDALEPIEVLRHLAQAQAEAAAVVEAAVPQIATAAELAASALTSGGRLIYAGAGSSGLMAMADALELPGTYGIAHDRIVVLLAGGSASLTYLAGGYEDDRNLARRDIENTGVGDKDCLLVATASGSTPYALEVADVARERGAKVVALANNPEAPLFALADVAILLATPPEVIAGSTRMGAGTAQKIAFNMLSTMVGIHLGHVHDGHMVNLKADNAKLKGRAARMIGDIAAVSPEEADRLLEASGGSVKAAILIAGGAANAAVAGRLLKANDNNLRRALAALKA